jgi:hypothetical protein
MSETVFSLLFPRAPPCVELRVWLLLGDSWNADCRRHVTPPADWVKNHRHEAKQLGGGQTEKVAKALGNDDDRTWPERNEVR